MRTRTRIAITCGSALVAALAFPSGAQAVGELTNAGCVDDNDSGDDVCASSVNGLAFPGGVAVSPDGRSVYVASQNDHAIVRFNRSTTGALTPAGCIEDDDVGPDGCAQTAAGLEGPRSVAVSPDGRSVYVASLFDDAIVGFDRDSNGALTPTGCVDDNDTGTDDCARSANGLAGAIAVTVSPDGRSVYATAFSDDAVVRLNRSSTGALSLGECVDDNDTGSDVCAQSVNGLDNPRSPAVSADGKSLYVTSPQDHAVVRFNRDSTGALTPAGCVDDNDFSPDTCALSVDGLDGVAGVAVSPDGSSVYAVSQQDNAVVRFNRSSTGALTPAGCVDDNDFSPDVCAQSVNGLDFANAVAVSSDGKSVYVVSELDDAIVGFNRASTGALTPAGCIDDNDSGSDVCAASVNGLENARAVAGSPDGRSVYVSAVGDDAVVRFNRQV